VTDSRRRRLALVLAPLALALLVSCRGKGEPIRGPVAKVAAQDLGGELNIYIWSAYLPQEVVDEFTRRTGVKVSIDLYDSSEALLAKLQSGVADYDLVVPGDYMVHVLIGEKLIQPLDKTKLHGLGNLDPHFLDRGYDRGNHYTLPYLWGTTGIGYDRKKLGNVDSVEALFDPRHKGRILMLDDMREVFGVALRRMGHSINERDPAVLATAAAMLEAQKPLVATYDSGDFANILAAGDVDLAQGYSGQLAAAVQEHADRLAYVVPKEGGTLWIDNMAIPTGARHAKAALAFIDYVLEPEVEAKIVGSVKYASPNTAAKAFIDPKIVGDPSIYPDAATLARCELIEDLGETTTLLDRYWTEIKSR
jgi:spermidine/putrescine-binding protein